VGDYGFNPVGYGSPVSANRKPAKYPARTAFYSGHYGTAASIISDRY
jgi:hypothetical protein